MMTPDRSRHLSYRPQPPKSTQDRADNPPQDLDYASAYDLFDLINVAHLNNAASPAETQEQLFQLRTLADSVCPAIT